MPNVHKPGVACINHAGYNLKQPIANVRKFTQFITTPVDEVLSAHACIVKHK